MIELLGALALGIGMVALSVGVKRAGDTISRGVGECSSQLQAALSGGSQGPPRDPELSERMEAVERRVSLALDDLNRQYRKLRQARRDLGEEEPEPEQLELADQLRRSRSEPSPAPSNGRPRLRPLRR